MLECLIARCHNNSKCHEAQDVYKSDQALAEMQKGGPETSTYDTEVWC